MDDELLVVSSATLLSQFCELLMIAQSLNMKVNQNLCCWTDQLSAVPELDFTKPLMYQHVWEKKHKHNHFT